MIVNIPAYDPNFFSKNGLVWGSFRGRLSIVQIVYDNNYLIGFSAITKHAPVILREEFDGFVLPVHWLTRQSLVLPNNTTYSRSLWKKKFDLPVFNTESTEQKNLDGVYRTETSMNTMQNSVEYVASDNHIVDILVTSVSAKEDYKFVPVGGHVG